MSKTKAEWLKIFREQADKEYTTISAMKKTYKDKASDMNKSISYMRDAYISRSKEGASSQDVTSGSLLESILLITYVSYIVMLEYRNKFWPYEYMSFARRIGELWEPFCKLAFEYPIKMLKRVQPPTFEKVQRTLISDAVSFINGLDLPTETKDALKKYYEIPWRMVDSGGIKLSLDLHFIQDDVNCNCDFKSGFSSNEKGNTNRLLLVASIYRFLSDKQRTILFVRQSEDQNNHYLQTLKNSKLWEVYCANDAYTAINGFTGIDIRKWLDINAKWAEDIDADFRSHLEKNDLLKYLTW